MSESDKDSYVLNTDMEKMGLAEFIETAYTAIKKRENKGTGVRRQLLNAANSLLLMTRTSVHVKDEVLACQVMSYLQVLLSFFSESFPDAKVFLDKVEAENREFNVQ